MINIIDKIPKDTTFEYLLAKHNLSKDDIVAAVDRILKSTDYTLDDLSYNNKTLGVVTSALLNAFIDNFQLNNDTISLELIKTLEENA